MNNIKKIGAIQCTVAFCSLFSMETMATIFNYNSVEFGFTANPSSIETKGRMVFMEGAHFVANLNTQFDGDWIASVGVGFQAPITEFIDVYGDTQIYNVKYTLDDKHDWGELGFGLNLGLRAWVLPQIEVGAVVGQIAFDSHDTRSIVELSGRFHSTETLALGATFRANGLYKQQLYFNVIFTF